jgi:hypothetical protein
MTVRKSEMHLRSGNVDVGWLSQAGVWPESATYERRRAIVIKRGRPLDAQSIPGLRKSGSHGGSPPPGSGRWPNCSAVMSSTISTVAITHLPQRSEFSIRHGAPETLSCKGVGHAVETLGSADHEDPPRIESRVQPLA